MLNVLWIVVVFQFHLLQINLNQDLYNKNGKWTRCVIQQLSYMNKSLDVTR